MLRFFSNCVAAWVLAASPVFAELAKTETPAGQISWSDDFLRTSPEFSDYPIHLSYCNSSIGPRPRYTAFVPDIVVTPVHYANVEIGGGRLLCSNDVIGRPGFGGGAIAFAALGWFNYVGACVGANPVPFGQTDTVFDDANVCMFAGFEFSRWHLRDGEGGLASIGGADGVDNAPGFLGVDDDQDGQTDNDFNELFGNILKNTPVLVDPYGPDGQPGLAGIDDDGNGITDDDLNERGFGDDADDNQGRGEHLFLMRADIAGGTAMYVSVDPGDPGGSLFSLGQFSGGFFLQTEIEGGDETGQDFFVPGVRYSFIWCAASSCYGAQLWVGNDRGNPVETLGPVVHAGVTGAVVAVGAQMIGSGANSLMEQWAINGNESYHDKFWVVEGDLLPLVPTDRDGDADVDGVDFTVFASCYNKSGRPPRTIGCDSDDAGAFDADGDGDVDLVDFTVFASCFNKSGRPPRRLGCIPDLTMCP